MVHQTRFGDIAPRMSIYDYAERESQQRNAWEQYVTMSLEQHGRDETRPNGSSEV
jgi:hypothetical protein